MPNPEKMDADGESRATDAMLEQREKEMKYSPKARSWEEGRKREWKANKKYYLRDQQHKEQLKQEKIVKEVLNK